jgi:Zn-dependent protease with chaperone function
VLATRQKTPARAELRLNPFALPSDTTSRFVLLIVAVLTASVFAYNVLSATLPATQTRFLDSQRCVEGAQARSVPDTVEPIDQERLIAQARDACRRPYQHWVAAVILLGVLGLLFVALTLYLAIPSWKIRRRRLVPLEEDDAPELVDSYHELCRQAGLSRAPALLWNPLAPRGGALAFGRFGRYYVAVSASLVVQHYTNREATMAVLRHELAHVANRDVNKTYLAQSLWYAFVVAGLLPLLVVELALAGPSALERLWRVPALVVLVYAARNAVLRSREYYADASAADSGDQRSTLAGVLVSMPPRTSTPLSRFWSVHPDRDDRIRALWDTDELFRLRLADVLAAGVLAGFAYPTVKAALFLVVPLEYTLYIEAGAAVVSAALLGVVLGTGVWRTALAARARNGPVPRVGAVALVAAPGLGAGSLLHLGGDILPAATSVALVFFLLISLHWLVATADAWFDAVPSTRSGSLFSWGGIIAAALVVWGTGWLALFAPALRSQTTASLPEVAGLFVAEHALTPVVIASLVVLPLTASLLRRRVRGDFAPGWLMADGTAHPPPPWPDRPPLAVASALRTGALGGGTFCLIILALKVLGVSPRALLGPFEQASADFAPGLHHGAIGLAVVLQAGVAGIASARSRRLAVLHTLFALPTSVLLMTLGVVLHYVLDAGGIPTDGWRIARLLLLGGALAALIVGGATDAIRQGPRGTRTLIPGVGVAVLLLAIVQGDNAASPPPTSAPTMTPAEAHTMARQRIEGDPALPRGIRFESFDALARSNCAALDVGESARGAVSFLTTEPTGWGIPVRHDSAVAIVEASIRAYCPHHAAQLGELQVDAPPTLDPAKGTVVDD